MRIKNIPSECDQCHKIVYKSADYFTPRKSSQRKHSFCQKCALDWNSKRMSKWNKKNNSLAWHKKTCLKGKDHPLWKGLSRRKDGYFRITLETSSRKLYHRFIMEKLIGRELTKNEVVHHKDGNPSNNTINNLLLTTRKEHMKFHSGDKHWRSRRKPTHQQTLTN